MHTSHIHIQTWTKCTFAITKTNMSAHRDLPTSTAGGSFPISLGPGGQHRPLSPEGLQTPGVYTWALRIGCFRSGPKQSSGRENSFAESPGVQLFAAPQPRGLKKLRSVPRTRVVHRCSFQETWKTVACGGGWGTSLTKQAHP